jgi:soluble lytic murein transglycosylase
MRTLVLLCLALVPSTASAEVKVRLGEDGVPFIYNETSEQRSVRLSTELRQVRSSELKQWIEDHARRQGLDRRLVQAVIQVESGYNHRARSRKGAMGLMQLMPDTARELGIRDPYDPEANIRAGTLYLRRMLDHFSQDLQLALAAYNAGPAAVRRHGGMPPYRETRNYVRRVLALVEGKELAIDVPAAPRPKIYVSRDAQNRLFMTTTPPGNKPAGK